MEKDPNEIKAVRTTTRILEKTHECGHVGVTELANELDLPKSTVYTHLNTLTNKGYVVRTDSKYRIGLKFLEFGEHARNRMELYTVAKPELQGVADETGDLVNLMTEEFGTGVYVDRFSGENAVQLDTLPGLRVDLHCTGLGKAILAHLPESTVDEIIAARGMEKKTENTITDRDVLLENLEEIREQGYAIDDEERAEGLRCVAVPIVQKEAVHGAISVSAPVPRMRGTRFHEHIPELLINAASVIEINMTYG